LDSTSVSKQNLGQLLIPTICVGGRSGKYGYAMLDGLDHTLGHPIALRPLGCSTLVLNCIVLTHHIELCSPLPPIISQYELRDTEPTDYVILQKHGCCSGSMIGNCLRFTPLGIVVNGHQDVFVA
jgi:hypothetical protein